MMHRGGILLVVLCALGIALAACRGKPGLDTTVTTMQAEASPTLTRQLSATPPPTSTAPPPAATTSTPSPSPFAPTATPTSIPTLTEGEREAYIRELFETNAGCELPCWWGITPGKTTWQEAKIYLDTFSMRMDEYRDPDFPERTTYGFYFKVPEGISPHGRTANSYLVRGNEIEYIIAFPHHSKLFSLSQLLGKYGPPEQVWLRTFDQPRDQVLPFHLILFYPSQGFMAEFSVSAELHNGSVRGCLKDIQPTLWLWSSEQRRILYDIANLNQAGFIAEEFGYYRPLRDVTEIDVEAFYEAFKDFDSSLCVETPVSLWPPPS